MAPKRIIEDPPPAASSSAEEETEDSEETEEDGEETGQQDVANRQNGAVVEEKDASSDEDEQPEIPLSKSTLTQNHPISGSDSGTESDSDYNRPSAYTIKPIVVKPSKQPAIKSPKPALKRPAESDLVVKESPSLKKKKKATENGGNEEEAKKGGRFWSEEDEIAILKGMIEYRKERGSDPFNEIEAFNEFIKESLHVEPKKSQLQDKVRRLRQKYQKNLEKVQNEESLAGAHDILTFGLSKQIWGPESDGNKEKAEENSKAKKDGAERDGGRVGATGGVPENSKAKKDGAERDGGRVGGSGGLPENSKAKKDGDRVCASGGLTLALVSKGEELGGKKKKETVNKMEKKNDVGRGDSREQKIVKKLEITQVKEDGVVEEEAEEAVDNIEESLCLKEVLGMEGLPEDTKWFLWKNLKRIGIENLKELEGKWRALKQLELELFVQRANLFNEQVKLVLDAVKSE